MYSGERVPRRTIGAARCMHKNWNSFPTDGIRDTARKFQLCGAVRRSRSPCIYTHRCRIRPSFSTALRFVLPSNLSRRNVKSRQSVNACRVVAGECFGICNFHEESDPPWILMDPFLEMENRSYAISNARCIVNSVIISCGRQVSRCVSTWQRFDEVLQIPSSVNSSHGPRLPVINLPLSLDYDDERVPVSHLFVFRTFI